MERRILCHTVMMVAMALAGCQHGHAASAALPVAETMGTVFTVPMSVQRIAVFYPRSGNPDFLDAYQRLEGATFQLKATRPTLRIVDRFHLPAIVTEQRFQLSGNVTDESVVRAGQLLGVDSVLLYTIDGPGLRDRIFARRLTDVRPVTVTTKLIRVETAEVLFHNVVSAPMDDGNGGWSLEDNLDYHQLTRAALDRGIARTMADLQRAFH